MIYFLMCLFFSALFFPQALLAQDTPPPAVKEPLEEREEPRLSTAWLVEEFPLHESTVDSEFYYYKENLPDFRGLETSLQLGYRIPRNSLMEAGFELSLTFSSPNPSPELEELTNQSQIQVYSQRTSLLRFRVFLHRKKEGSPNLLQEVTYLATESEGVFLERFLQELSAGRTATLILSHKNSHEKIHLNLPIEVSRIEKLMAFVKSLNPSLTPAHSPPETLSP